MNARDELANLLWDDAASDRVRDGKIPRLTPVVRAKVEAAADKILAAGYQKPKVLGYIVVDRGGVIVGTQHKHEESARAFAADWSKECEDAGIDWDYRVATITEASA